MSGLHRICPERVSVLLAFSRLQICRQEAGFDGVGHGDEADLGGGVFQPKEGEWE
jgi:hypothetical protein